MTHTPLPASHPPQVLDNIHEECSRHPTPHTPGHTPAHADIHPPPPAPTLQVLADIHEECNRHGTVLRVVVPRPHVPAQSAELMGTGSYGLAFVQFLDVEGAKLVSWVC